jgi:hypothetical protein
MPNVRLLQAGRCDELAIRCSARPSAARRGVIVDAQGRGIPVVEVPS